MYRRLSLLLVETVHKNSVENGLLYIKLFLFFTLLTTLTLISYSALGEAWIVTPEITVEGRYDDNFRLSSQDEESGQRIDLKSLVNLARETDTSFVGASAGIDAFKYFSSDLDDRVNFFGDVEARYKTELDEWTLRGNILRDTTLTTVDVATVPTSTPDAPADDDPGLTDQEIKRFTYSLIPSWKRNFTERTSGTLEYILNGREYLNASDTNLNEYQLHNLSGRLSYGLTPVDQIFTIANGGYFRERGGDRKYYNVSLQFGIEHEFSETFRTEASIGGRYTDFDTPGDDGSESGLILRLFAVKRTEVSAYSVNFYRGLLPSGSGDAVQSNDLTLRYTRRFTPRLQLISGLRYFKRDAVGNAGDSAVDRDYFSVEPRLGYDISRWWNLNASYRYRWQDRKNESGNAKSNAFFVWLTYSKPFIY